MDHKEFFSKYIYDRRNDVILQSRFGTIYKATHRRRNTELYLRVMPVSDPETTHRLASEVEFANSIPESPFIVTYKKAYTFEESTAEVDCAVMDYYPLGTLRQLLEDWKLNDEERQNLHNAILKAVEHLRSCNINIGPFNPETIFVSEDNGILTPHLIDLSGFETDNADFETQLNEFLPIEPNTTTESEEATEQESATDEVDETQAEITSEENQPDDTDIPQTHHNKWLLLLGVILTWTAVIGLIYIMHQRRNAADENINPVDTMKVIYPADEYAIIEARIADSIAAAQADSIARADSIATAKKAHIVVKNPTENTTAKDTPEEPQKTVTPPADVPAPVIEPMVTPSELEQPTPHTADSVN